MWFLSIFVMFLAKLMSLQNAKRSEIFGQEVKHHHWKFYFSKDWQVFFFILWWTVKTVATIGSFGIYCVWKIIWSRWEYKATVGLEFSLPDSEVVSREAQFVCNAVMPSWLGPSSSAHKNSNFLPGKWWLIGPSSQVQTADTQLLNFLPPFIEMRKRHMKKLPWLLQRLILAGQKLHFSRTSLDRI